MKIEIIFYALEKDNKVSNYLRLCGYVVFSVA